MVLRRSWRLVSDWLPVFKPNLQESMVQLLGGSAQDPFGDRQFVKKIKAGGVNLGLMMQIVEDRKKRDTGA
jgi:hypothetical protein